ncbi:MULTISPECIES: glutathione S-transferase N-terminal domain-containing protein [Pseudoxanthomonas]|nr:glutathione S-transferase N-terminal domain-containing protein [Pseudoxanthomonas winnipegensis]WJI15868.1 glutathione S-transferase N-terminal domain-containing protein [Pseudoxanthomonas winnipegensis]
MMKLYYAPGTCALACWIALEWAGADYEAVKVDPHADAYRAINPLGTVPALDIGGARAMTQADAILQYIVQRHPEAGLGADAGIEAQFVFNETLAFLTGDMHPAFWPFFTPERYTTDASEAALQAVRDAAPARIARVLAHLDALIGDTDHVYAGRRSVADAYAFVMARWSDKAGESWRKYPNLARFMQAMAHDPAVKTVLERSSGR